MTPPYSDDGSAAVAAVTKALAAHVDLLAVVAKALVETGGRLWSTSLNNTPDADRVRRWMTEVIPGSLVVELTSSREPAIDRVGVLVSKHSGHECTIRTFDNRELRWENAAFVRIPRDADDNREISEMSVMP